MSDMIHRKRERLAWRVNTLSVHMPLSKIDQLRNQLKQFRQNLRFRVRAVCKDESARLKAHTDRLKGLSPNAILARGYSITFTVPEREIVRDADAVHAGQAVEVSLARGRIQCRVEGKK